MGDDFGPADCNLDGIKPQAQIVRRCQKRQSHKNGAARQRLQRHPQMDPVRQFMDAFEDPDQKGGANPKKYARENHLQKKRFRKSRDEILIILKIVDPEIGGYPITDHPRYERREKHFIKNASNEENLDPEDGAGNRRSQNGGKAGTDPADHQFLSIIGIEFQDIRKER